MTVQKFKPRGTAEEQQPSADILSTLGEPLDDKEQQGQLCYRAAPQDSENLLGRVLAGESRAHCIVRFTVFNESSRLGVIQFETLCSSPEILLNRRKSCEAKSVRLGKLARIISLISRDIHLQIFVSRYSSSDIHLEISNSRELGRKRESPREFRSLFPEQRFRFRSN